MTVPHSQPQTVPDTELLRHLKRGAGRVRSSYELALKLGVNQRAVGFMVSRLRKAGWPIGSIHGEGYFIISNERELNDTISHIEQRKDGIDRTVRSLRQSFARRCV